MKKPMFTAEELAELAAYDAQIDEQPITMDEMRASRERDTDARLDRLDHRSRAIAACKREYYAANKEAIAAHQREYRAANKEAIAAHKREYRAANKEAIAAYQREYYAANKEAIAAYKREYRAANKEAIAAYQREYRAANKEAIAAYQREYYAANKEAIAAYKREYYPGYYYADRPKRDDIRLCRKARGMSQAELASRVGISPPMISMIERGRANARQEILQEIYRVLGMEVTHDVP